MNRNIWPTSFPLQALVHAIVSSVTEAQQEVEKAQVGNLAAYLDREQRPLALRLRVPSIRPEAVTGEEDYYQAPLLALVPHSMLRIKQAEISFDIELSDLSSPSTAKPEAPRAQGTEDVLVAQVKRELNVSPAVSAKCEIAWDFRACRSDD